MDFDFGATADALRAELRSLIATEIPADFLGAFTDDPDDLEIAQRFCARLASEQLLTLTWPVEYGGRGGSVWDQTVVREEMWAHHEPRGAQYMGLNWVGPAIMAFGTDEQKAFHLPAIAAGHGDLVSGLQRARRGLRPRCTEHEGDRGRRRLADQRSEDLDVVRGDGAVLRARGTRRREREQARGHHTVPGSDGHARDHRASDPQLTRRASPQRGVLRRRRRRRQHRARRSRERMAGHPSRADVRARRDRPGTRAATACCPRSKRELGSRFDELPTTVRASWVRALVAVRVARLLAYRVVHLQAEGTPADTAASVGRIAVTQADQLVAEALFQALDSGSLRDKASGAVLHGAVEDHYRYAQAATVASGTIEIQRMIVGRATVGRP